jgi:hypothetical protein
MLAKTLLFNFPRVSKLHWAWGAFVLLGLLAAGAEAQPLSVSLDRQNPSCFGGSDGSATLLVSGGTTPYTYLWSTGETTASITGLSAGLYAYTVTDAVGGTRSGNFSLFTPGPIIANASATGINTCFGDAVGTATVNPSGGTPPYSVEWSNGDSGASIGGLVAGAYGYTITDANGCTREGGISVISFVSPIVLSLERTQIDGFGDSTGTASLTASGGTPPYSFLWSTGATTSAIANLTAGVYGYTVTDANGCAREGDFSIIELWPILPNVSKTDVTCFGFGDGTATLDPVMGTPPFTVLWSTGETTRTITNLQPGPYRYTVTDANNCTAEGGFSIVTPWPIIPNLTIGFDECGSTASLDPFEGTPPFTFLWSTGDTTSSVSGLAGGTYSYTITDANLCEESDTFEIVAPPILSCRIDILQLPSTGGAANGRARAVAIAGTAPYSYLWSNGETTSLATALPVGLISVTITDANGCESVCSINLAPADIDPCIPLTDPGKIGFDQVLCGPGNIPEPLVNVVAPSGGVGTIEYLWMKSTEPGPFNDQTWTMIPNSNSPNLVLGPVYQTTYFARCARIVDCIAYLETEIITITVGDDAIADIQGPEWACIDESASFTVLTATPDAQISWSFTGPATPATVVGRDATISFTSFGTVNVTVTVIENGCTASKVTRLNVFSGGPYCGGIIVNAESLVAYPNPVREEVTLVLPYSEEGEVTEIEFYDLTGRPLIQQRRPGQEQQVQIDVSSLPPGFYYVHVMRNGRLVQLGKLNKL